MDCHSFMLFVWSDEKSRVSRPFPPQEKKAFHDAVLREILEERVVSSRSRRNPRGVKRKMSGYPLRPRERTKTMRLHVENHIAVIK
jgi:hypothetical protein